MDTNLMGTAGFQLTFNVGIFSTEPLQNTVVCNRILSVFIVDCLLFAINRMSADRLMNGAGIFGYIVIYNGLILSGNGMSFQLFCQRLMCNIIFADN